MPVHKLTQSFVSGLKPEAKPTIVFDSELKGFGVRIMPSGKMTWILEYRPNGGGRTVAKRRMSLGPVDAATTALQARQMAKDTLAKVRTGEDPAGALSAARKAETVEQMLAAFLDDHIRLRRKPNTVEAYDRLVRLVIGPSIGKKKVIQVTHADVARMVSVASSKRSRENGQVIGGRAIANKSLAVLSSAYSWASQNGITPPDFNPCQKIEKFEEKARERYLDPDELTRLSDALIEAETIGLPYEVDQGKPTAKHAKRPENRRTLISTSVTNCIRLLILTGCRLREILNLEWVNVDIERGLLLLPDSKTGKKFVVLSPAAVEILKSTPRIGRYVVASTSAGTAEEAPRHDIKKPWAALTRHADLEGLRIHDLRHSFASFAAARGVSLQAIGALLGHKSIRSTERYAHLANDPLRQAANGIGNFISSKLKS